MKVILWTGHEDQAVELRNEIRAQGHACVIRNAGCFNSPSDAEPCHAIAFHHAANRDQILSIYRGEGYVARHGHVQLLELELGKHGEPIAVPALPPPPPPPKSEADYLDDRLANLSYDDLRTYVAGVTGQEPPPAADDPASEADREALIALLRSAQPSAAPPPPAVAAESSGAPPATNDEQQGADSQKGAGGRRKK